MNTLGFFSDTRLQAFAASLVPHVSAFVETGAEEGKTTLWAAEHFRYVYACEIDADRLAKLWQVLPQTVQLYALSSPQFIEDIALIVGVCPLFFLDAHWQTYWPLLDELRAITGLYASAVIIVHDCRVPDRPNFWACRGGGGDNDGPVCEWEYIRQGLETWHTYHLLYPTYDAQTPGYCVLFMDCYPMGDLRDLQEVQQEC